MGDEHGRSILVTGAAGGLGLETALALAARGFRVFGGVRDPADAAGLRDVARDRGVSIEPLALDVVDDPSVAAAVERVVDTAGGLYGVVNNAGIQVRGYFEDVDDAEI